MSPGMYNIAMTLKNSYFDLEVKVTHLTLKEIAYPMNNVRKTVVLPILEKNIALLNKTDPQKFGLLII